MGERHVCAQQHKALLTATTPGNMTLLHKIIPVLNGSSKCVCCTILLRPQCPADMIHGWSISTMLTNINLRLMPASALTHAPP